jgi:UDP-N-acetylglucosamine 2-epimerase (hydrolysing)
VYLYNNQAFKPGMDITLANTIYGFSCYVNDVRPDLIIVHGDRAEALAGAITGSFNNTLVGHIEGGEVSGTIDELIRHSVTKLSHAHFAANEHARRRLMQMGESSESIFVVGSPEVDFMLSDRLPALNEAKAWYEIPFDDYGIFVYHPVTTEDAKLSSNVRQVVDAIIESGLNYIVVRPNNDTGHEIITDQFRRFECMPNIRMFPSIRFEYFMTFFKHSRFIIGNSSAGVREAPVFGVPSINIGTRQDGRNYHESIFDVGEDKESILSLIRHINASRLRFSSCCKFGGNNSVGRFMDVLRGDDIWGLPIQKRFADYHQRRLKMATERHTARIKLDIDTAMAESHHAPQFDLVEGYTDD